MPGPFYITEEKENFLWYWFVFKREPAGGTILVCRVEHDRKHFAEIIAGLLNDHQVGIEATIRKAAKP